MSEKIIIDEDATDTSLTFNIPKQNLVDPDAGEGVLPTKIRIVEIEGGTLKLNGTNYNTQNHALIQLDEVKSGGQVVYYKKDFTFSPDENRTDDVIIKYSIVDPVRETLNSQLQTKFQ